MRALLQRVHRCSVSIEHRVHSFIGPGLLVFLGVGVGDKAADADYLVRRCLQLRVFPDADGKMNRSITETGGSILVVSQFTLYADTRRGNRPSYTDAAPPPLAEQLYNQFVAGLRGGLSADRVATGVFGAMMDVELINAGPVTINLESRPSPS